MKKQTKVKLSLISTIGVSLLAVSSAAVSTFAWFQAQAQVNVSASSADPVEITVSAPTGSSIGTPAYFVYKDPNTNKYLYKGNAASGTTLADTPVNFVSVGSGEGNLGSSQDLKVLPGWKLTFGIKVQTISGTVSNVSLKLDTYETKNILNRKVISNYTSTLSNLTEKLSDNTTDRIIRIEEGIDIYGQINTTGSFVTSYDSADKFKTYNVNDQQSSSTAKSYSSQDIEIIASSSLGSVSTVYLFYTITISNTDTTVLYQEYASANTIQYNTPNNDSSPRYFYKTASGNSNCYEGLEFNVKKLVITAS